MEHGLRACESSQPNIKEHARGNKLILAFQKVTKIYSSDGQTVRALHEVSFEMAAAEFFALVGRSGCGKSTLLNLAGAMDYPTEGSVTLDGITTSCRDDGLLTRLRREKVGFIFQSFQLFPTLTAIENVELPLLLAGRRDASCIAQERLESVGMKGMERRHVHQLSGGQLQRVAIARALAHSPRLLLADEPTGQLDNTSAEDILGLLQRLTREHGIAVLMATHSREAAAFAELRLEMRDGCLERVVRQKTRC
jgi:putative ABC transport system ATP-binding protein